MKNIGYSFNGFTTARLKRFLNTGGQSLMFTEVAQNEYGEPTEQTLRTVSILGVLHISSNAMIDSSETASVGSKSRVEPLASVITSWESLADGYAGGKEILPGMYITIGEVKYVVIKSANVNDWGLVANISLENYDEWKH